MDRTVPRIGSDEIELYIRTYYSLLRSTGQVQLEALVEAHANMNSSLHAKARSLEPDIDALTYTSSRLPDCIFQVRLVVLGQSQDVFVWRKYPAVESWHQVTSIGRRRRLFFDGNDTLAAYIASRSDIDDFIPILTAFQIEWNKLHHLLQGSQIRRWLVEMTGRQMNNDDLAVLAGGTGISFEDVSRLDRLWGKELAGRLYMMSQQRKRFALHLLDSSLAAYRKAIRRWWAKIEESVPDIEFLERPVYFISSNTHSITNLLSGYALQNSDRLIERLDRSDYNDLMLGLDGAQDDLKTGEWENLLYFVQKIVMEGENARDIVVDKTVAELQVGIRSIPSSHSFDVEAQIIQLDLLDPARFDPRLRIPGLEALRHSNAIIINIDYPLGMAAYQILTEIARNIHYFKGIYVLGKAATLNGRIGDVMIPSVVYDEHSQNTYLFPNCFSSADLAQYLIHSTVMDNQKAITVRGTFLQNPKYVEVIYREGYTDIEMEGGPFLSAITESIRPARHPYNEIVNLYPAPFDIGLIHYASDKPLSKGKTLGTKSLSIHGIEPTYAASTTILKRILERECRNQ
ncbi:MAG: hypothetical protein JXA42_16300 [Anaerolineales bacterium]|nr:hypothetical protein [Anaerolineales bacterium]